MEPGIQDNVHVHKKSRKKIVIISLIILSILMLAAAAQLVNMTLRYDRVYKGVYINNINAGGMSINELKAHLKKEFQDKLNGLEIVFETDRMTEKLSYIDLKASYDVESAANKAYGIGRTGNIFDRLYDIISTASGDYTIDMPLSYNKEKLDKTLTEFYNKTLVIAKDPDISVREDNVTINSGHHGETIDKSIIESKAVAMISECTSGTIKAEVTITPQLKIDVNDLYDKIYLEPVEATYKVENNTTILVPHAIGRKIDKTVLADIVSELEKNENMLKVLPVEFIEPEITTEDANALLFKDKLATKSTHFSTSTTNDKNRGDNIKIAIGIINGKILGPGDIFSFNDIVGPRTEEGGYQKAHTYTAGKVVDGIGGGICQVSSTLYGAVLKSDLEVVERRNHMFTVGYVPFGQDATVSYGTTDFKFKNSTRWPVKIESEVTKNNNIIFTFKGTNETPGKEVILTSQELEKIPFTTEYIDDPALQEGKTEIKQEGKEGYIIDTFKTIKQDGKVISKTKLHTSSYKPLVQQILRGTKKIDIIPSATPEPSPQPDPSPQPEQTSPVVDDADNPPAE